MTEPEKRLWWHLRYRLGVPDAHFRRQVAIGCYIVDFCSLRYRFIIEVDGEQHGFGANVAKDAERTRALAGQGFRVMRFSNREVMVETRSVLDTIFAALTMRTPTPGPSPQGGGECVVPSRGAT